MPIKKDHCNTCGQSFDEVERYVSHGKTRVRSTNFCHSCFLKHMRDKNNERNKNYSLKTKKFKLSLILSKGGRCQICGYNDLSCPAIFEFHHLDPSKKEHNIASLLDVVQTREREELLQKELENCILVCANCHRKLHWGNI